MSRVKVFSTIQNMDIILYYIYAGEMDPVSDPEYLFVKSLFTLKLLAASPNTPEISK